MFSLRLFGGVSLAGEDGPLAGPATQRHRLALLALLALSHPRAVAREKLMACLWPERDAEHARKLLNQAVHALRKALGEEAILSAGDELRLGPTVIGCDVFEFEEALAAGELERAVSLYAGPLLDGFFLPRAPEFERWADRERERLAACYGNALEALAEAAEGNGAFFTAVEWWKAKAVHDPFDSRVALRLMQALDASGNPAGALQHAIAHEQLLREELAVEPGAEVQALAERLRSEPPVAAADTGEGDRADPPSRSAARSPVENADPASRAPPPATVQRAHRLVPWRSVTLTSVAILGLAGALLVSRLFSDGNPPAGSVREAEAYGGRAIAVLPFENLSGRDEDVTFANAIHSDLITALAGIAALSVVSRASVLPYRSQTKPLRQIGEELNVDVLLEGAVQRLSDRLRVNAQLSDAKTGRLLWADSYERELTVGSIFVLQREISERIAASLEASLTTAERQRLGTPPTGDLSAYQYYHKAVETYAGTRAGNEEEERLLRMAVHADPRFAPAWARLAANYGWRAPYLGYPISAWDSAHAYLERALEIDPDLSGAYGVLALIEGHQGFLDRQERAAREAYRRDPSADFPLRRLAESYRDRGDFLEALRWHREAVNRSPHALHHRTWIAYVYADLGEYDEAERWYRSVFQLEPDYHNALQGAALLNLRAGRADSAVHYAERIATRHPDEPHGLATAAMVGHYLRDPELVIRHAGRAVAIAERGAPVREINGLLVSTMLGFTRLQAGDTTEANSLLEQSLAFLDSMIARGADAPRWPFEIALIHAARGDGEAALAWLETAYDRGFRWVWMLEREPMLDALRPDPRFQGLVSRVRAEVEEMRRQAALQALPAAT